MRVEKTVFISYRRTNFYNALAVYRELANHGFDVFFDYKSIKSGSFEQIILNQIAARAHFILLLTPSALERCNEPGDWLRREIECALNTKRNIVPIVFESFNFNHMKQYLTGNLSLLPTYNALRVPDDYFDQAMERLRNEFLNVPLEVVIHSAPSADGAAVKQAQNAALQQRMPTENQLTAEKWFERAYQRGKDDLDGKIDDYTKAIDLNPGFATAYNNRGQIYFQQRHFHEALADYNQAIQIENTAVRFFNRGLAHYALGDLSGAIADFTSSLKMNPKQPDALTNRGLARYRRGEIENAIMDYTQAIELDPRSADAYRNRGVAYEKIENYGRANADYQFYIELGGSEANKVRGWIDANVGRMKQKR